MSVTVPQILGILNVTPDSFSDGGSYAETAAAVEHGALLFEQGATIIDVGGESTRPGADRVDPEEERRRILPVIRELSDRRIPVSVDTVNARTAAESITAGAVIVNDVSGGLADPAMAEVVGDAGVHFVAMHWRGGTDVDARYGHVVAEVRDELKRRVAELAVAGVDPSRVILDPGLGFAKNAEHNWQLLRGLGDLASLGHGILVGASRKRFLGGVVTEGATVLDRDLPTAVVSALSAQAGAWAVRVHDVPSTRVALDTWAAWQNGGVDAENRS
ncbi:dihydropteroate synthase [Schumannella sp. 10F1B-5-1]|uniref:dihydropteroate synthase n=1 Tax=Schumannella sp. 10F1B-5-1 TaxID=2590780 RepID=UPI001131E757|nr:dihydropteroate synthase [Schumannella sp. 10F1B-5-1]TPW71627.1 dihydropteroate synthase [Schumannella sp. 10F1B-5-1]